MLTKDQVWEAINTRFSGQVSNREEPYGLLTIDCAPDAVIDVLKWLRDEPTLKLAFLTDLTAVHYPERTGEEMCIVYHVHSLTNNFRLRIKAYIPIADPVIATATTVYDTANWMEREAYDFFGVIFAGHPNLIRILNMDDMDYFPMRKEYPLEDPTRRDKVDLMFGR